MFYKFQHNWDISTGGSPSSPFQTLDNTNLHSIGFDLTRGRLTHSIRMGYTNFNNAIISQELRLKFPKGPGGTPYQLNVGPYGAGPNGLAPQATYQDNYQYSYDGSYVRGRNTFRYGGSFTHIGLGVVANVAGPLTVNGGYDSSTLADLKRLGLDIPHPGKFPLGRAGVGPTSAFFTL